MQPQEISPGQVTQDMLPPGHCSQAQGCSAARKAKAAVSKVKFFRSVFSLH